MYVNLYCLGWGLVVSSVKGWGKGCSIVSVFLFFKGV